MWSVLRFFVVKREVNIIRYKDPLLSSKMSVDVPCMESHKTYIIQQNSVIQPVAKQ